MFTKVTNQRYVKNVHFSQPKNNYNVYWNKTCTINVIIPQQAQTSFIMHVPTEYSTVLQHSFLKSKCYVSHSHKKICYIWIHIMFGLIWTFKISMVFETFSKKRKEQVVNLITHNWKYVWNRKVTEIIIKLRFFFSWENKRIPFIYNLEYAG